jgi:hypothetical protein
MTSSHTDREVSDVVERVALAMHDFEDSWNDTAWEHLPEGTQAIFVGQAKVALEASHHAELVGALKHIRELLVAYGPRYIKKATRLADAVLAKMGGAS